jgi:hypothetical protein
MMVGENAWYLAQLATNADIDKTFADIAATGATTVRTWWVTFDLTDSSDPDLVNVGVSMRSPALAEPIITFGLVCSFHGVWRPLR